MSPKFTIRCLNNQDISYVTNLSRLEGFAPGIGDVGIYQHTDKQGIWVGCLDDKPIGCIAGIRYNRSYGFMGLFIVNEQERGKGYGMKLWKHALEHLKNIPCIGLEAAPERIKDYTLWGFEPSSETTRWEFVGNGTLSQDLIELNYNDDLILLDGFNISSKAVQSYDAKREPTPRPHFLSDWLTNVEGNVLVLMDRNGICHGFGRIRPCFLKDGKGWRIGPLIADTPGLAEQLLARLINKHPGIVLLDAPGLNPYANTLLSKIGFHSISKTLRMYRGSQPSISMNDVYGLACLELG